MTVEYGDGVIEITINRPEARNALNGAVRTGISEALAELDGRDDLAIGILAGGCELALACDLRVFASQDAGEGARAFAEKRAPQWKGR